MAIVKKVIYSVQDNEAVLNEDLVFYTNDGEVILEITLKNIEYNADKYIINVITPDNELERSFPELISSLDGTYYISYGFSVSNKPGKYEVQIILIENEINKLRLPEFNFEVKQDITGLIEPIIDTNAIVGLAITDESVLRSGETYSTGYTSEIWYTGDVITASKLNNMVNGIDEGIASANAALNGLSDKAGVGHTHEYAPTNHTHTKAQITDFPTNLSEFVNDIGAGSNNTEEFNALKTEIENARMGNANLGETIADIDAIASEALNKANELFTSVSNGKTIVASAITDKGVATSNTDTFSVMATNISNISVGVPPDIEGKQLLLDAIGYKYSPASNIINLETSLSDLAFWVRMIGQMDIVFKDIYKPVNYLNNPSKLAIATPTDNLLSEIKIVKSEGILEVITPVNLTANTSKLIIPSNITETVTPVKI